MAEGSKHEKIDGGRQDSRVHGQRYEEVSRRRLGFHGSASPAQFEDRSERQTLLAHLFHVSNDGIMVHELLPSPQMGASST